MPIYTKTPNGWEAIAQDAKAVSSFGSIVPDGNQTDEGTYTDADGREWVWYEWGNPGDWSCTTDGGLLRVLAVGGGSSEHLNVTYEWSGQPGLVNEGFWEFDAGTLPIKVGESGGAMGATSLGMPSSIDDYGTQGLVTWGAESTGRGATAYDDQTGYSSFITGSERKFATGYDGDEVPGRGSYRGHQAENGTVIIATVVNGAKPKPVQPALTPATIVSAPVKVSGSSDPVEWIVKQTDGTRKKITLLPGNTSASDFNVFEVTLSPGVLPGIMVAAGGTGGSWHNGGGGGGGAGGVIGTGCRIPVLLPQQEDATYTIKVAGTPLVTTVKRFDLAQPTTIEVQGQPPFLSAMGGGFGFSSDPNNGTNRGTGSGGSGGGGFTPYDNMADLNTEISATAGAGSPGQGYPGNGNAAEGGGGGGYNSGGEVTSDGGDGFNLKDSLGLDGTDAATVAFLDTVTNGGFIAGGGASVYGSPGQGGTVNKVAGKPYTGAGGGGNANGQPGAAGACGMVLLIEDA